MPESVSMSNSFSDVNPIIVEILAHAANAVATHFSFRTVIVEDAHRKVTAFVLPDEYNAVAADAFVPIAPSYGKFFGVGYWERMVSM